MKYSPLMGTFTKMDSGIVDSSIWAKSDKALRVWIALMAKSDAYGYVRIARPALAILCMVERDELDVILEELLAPDPDSRTVEDVGRLEARPGGFLIVNYVYYREMLTGRKASAAVKQRRYRERLKERDELHPKSEREAG